MLMDADADSQQKHQNFYVPVMLTRPRPLEKENS